MRTYNTIGILNNAGKWSSLSISSATKEEAEIPQRGIHKQSGLIKKCWSARLSRLSLADCLWIHERGGSITIS